MPKNRWQTSYGDWDTLNSHPLTFLVVWLNRIAGAIASVGLAPIAWLPGWLSATLIAAVTGVVMLVVFKYTSNQTALKQTRNQIKANLLALSLFKDDIRVGLRVQLGLLGWAARLLGLSLVPMLVMFVPMCLVLGQLGLWYQARPLSIGEEAVVTVHFHHDYVESIQQLQLDTLAAAKVTVGPVRVTSKKMVCWNIRADEPGVHQLRFTVGDTAFTKELAVGENYLPVSLERPSLSLTAMLLHPRESPFAADSSIQSIEVAYPKRVSWTTGTDQWMVYWFVASMVAAFLARPFLKVNL